jgi:hypothetical protein
LSLVHIKVFERKLHPLARGLDSLSLTTSPTKGCMLERGDNGYLVRANQPFGGTVTAVISFRKAISSGTSN